VNCAIGEAALVDELEVQTQIDGEGRLPGADGHWVERQMDLVDDTGAQGVRGESGSAHQEVAR